MTTNNILLPGHHLKRLEETQQNPKYHGEGNVLQHTQMVLNQFLETQDQFGLTEKEKEILYWACMLHDIGKPETTELVNGRWRSPGHEKAGVPLAREVLLEHPEIDGDTRRRILELVRWHGLPLWWVKLRKPQAELQALGTRLDLRLLAIFAEFDFRGRISEDQEETLGMIAEFRQLHVPKVEYELGRFNDMQEQFKSWDIRRKNAAWKAIQMERMDILQKLIENPDSISDPLHFSKKIYLTVGPPLSGKTTYLQRDPIPGSYRMDMEEYMLTDDIVEDKFLLDRKLVEFKYMLEIFHRRHQVVVIEGRNVNSVLRKRINELLREFNAEINYLVFESRLTELLQRNLKRDIPLSEELIRNQYKNFFTPHPWEAHQTHWVE
ncbi:MAG: HD domain-containing protein [Bacteroidia bacterium]|nr:HD domain-containing protein [Bacteroidia bacterium]